MTFLPIVERELRVAARRKGTYWTRVGVGLGALIVAGVSALIALFNPPLLFGAVYLQAMSGLTMAYCLGAGRFLTADSLSVEKREETMGLLFLTDLKGFDVVLGKMAATSLNGLYGMLALLPVLAITLLTGGITNAEFWRVAMVLVEAFFFSLSVGILASALSREFPKAMATNFYLLLGLAGALPAMRGVIYFFHPAIPPAEEWFFCCPIYTLIRAFDATYKGAVMQFWSSAALILWMSLTLIALACRIAPQSWQHKAVKRTRKNTAARTVSDAQARAFRTRMLDQNAYLWLAARPWWKARVVWCVLGAGLLWLVSMGVSIGWLDAAACIAVALVLSSTFKFWITLEAAQTLAEDMRSGAFELLLATPLTARDIVAGQTLALRRQFLKPVVAVVVLELCFMVTLMSSAHPGERFDQFGLWMASIGMLAADVITLSLVAMVSALVEKNISRALLRTVGRVMVAPWVLWGVVMALRQFYLFLFADPNESSWRFGLICWFWIGIIMDALLARKAWPQLRFQFRELALRRYQAAPARITLRARGAALGRVLRDQIWRRPRVRKWALAALAVLALGFSVKIWESNRSHVPPPEMVLTGPDNGGRLQVFPSGEGVFLILPDGSLWRWGLTEGTNRSRLPEQVGTNRDWSTLFVDNRSQRMGVRRDGTLWEWVGHGTPARIGSETNWAEAVSTQFTRVGRKRDGTLWAWGELLDLDTMPTVLTSVWLPPPPPLPHAWKAQHSVGTFNRNAGGPDVTMMGVEADGTLWVWGTVRVRGGSTNFYADPIQVCRETNWVGFQDRDPKMADGTTWLFFEAPPNPAVSANRVGHIFRTASFPVQLGTNNDWFALELDENSYLAMRTNGALYGWGEFDVVNSGLGADGRNPFFSMPTQICAETDWVGFDLSFGVPLARNRAGQDWRPGRGRDQPVLPGPTTPIRAVGRFFACPASSNQSVHPLPPFGGGRTRYEVHPDGTLWFRSMEYKEGVEQALIGPAQRADQRTDWVAVAATRAENFGLTADGTLWTWGRNLGENPIIKTQSRLSALSMQVQATLNNAPAPRPRYATATYELLETPRALMKLVRETGGKSGK